MEQLDLPLGDQPFNAANAALWTPRDIWVRLDQRLIEFLGEDRRYERKGTRRVNLDDLATYYSTFSNTPDGGLVLFGIEDCPASAPMRQKWRVEEGRISGPS